MKRGRASQIPSELQSTHATKTGWFWRHNMLHRGILRTTYMFLRDKVKRQSESIFFQIHESFEQHLSNTFDVGLVVEDLVH